MATSDAIIGSANLDAANTAFEAAASEVFDGGVPGVWQLFTHKASHTGTSFELVLVDGAPRVREWTTGGAKRFKQLRAYRRNFPLRKWEATIKVAMDEINGDRTGIVAGRLAAFARRQAAVYDDLCISALIANRTGYDGQAMLSASHPNVNGTTHDNLESAALTRALFNTAWEQMTLCQDESGEPLGITPTHLLVGPQLVERAMFITGSETPVTFDASGEPDGTGLGALLVQNYTRFGGGMVETVMSPRITGNQWFLMDCSKSFKPMYLAEFEAPKATMLTSPEDQNVFLYDEAWYSITAKASPEPMAWQCVHGSVT